jgi:hypothetical protein
VCKRASQSARCGRFTKSRAWWGGPSCVRTYIHKCESPSARYKRVARRLIGASAPHLESIARPAIGENMHSIYSNVHLEEPYSFCFSSQRHHLSPSSAAPSLHSSPCASQSQSRGRQEVLVVGCDARMLSSSAVAPRIPTPVVAVFS